MNFKKIISVCAAGALAAGLLTACGTNNDKNAENDNGNAKVTIWTGSAAPSIDGYDSIYETPGYKQMVKELGTELEYVYCTAGQEWEQFNLLLASGKFPDIVNFWWGQVPGGVDKLINSGIIYKMDAEFLKKNAPDFYKQLEENNIYDKACKTDGGDYYQFPKFFDYQGGKDEPLYTNGFYMRKDWLDECGLQVPETIDEWHDALKAFKEKKGASSAFTSSMLPNGLEGAFGIMQTYYHDGNTIKFGPYEDKYEDFLTTMHQWYEEGLIDQNLVGITGKQVTSSVLNGKAGATWGWLGSDFGTWINAAGGSLDMVGVQMPVANKGDTAEYSIAQYPVLGQGSIISGKSANPELLAKILNYGYSDAGHMLANFGIEGESYTMDGDSPVYTDKILHDENGLSVAKARQIYCISPAGNYREDYRYIQQYYNLKEQQEAQEIWRSGNGKEHIIPELAYTEAEADERSKIVTTTNTYIEEMTSKFIIGLEPLEKFGEYKQHLKDLGIEKAISITQSAYDRYLSR